MGLLRLVPHLPGAVRSLVVKQLRRRHAAAHALHPEAFRGQRILLLGPARTLFDDLAGLDTARFDLFVRMNNGLDTPIPMLGTDALRCDVLFHSLTDEAGRWTAKSCVPRMCACWCTGRPPGAHSCTR